VPKFYNILRFPSAILIFAVAGTLVPCSPLAAPAFSRPPAQEAKPCSIDSIPQPRVLVTPSRLEFLRQDIKTNAVRRGIYEKDVKANADRWLHRDITIPEQGGWAHYFCGPDGVLLELPADQQFDPNVASRSPTTGQSYDSEKIRAARHFFEHYWLAFAIRDLALTGIIEGKNEYAAKAAEILLKYANVYPHFAAETNGFGLQQNSLSESVSLIPMAQGFDLICHSGALTPGQKQRIEQDFFWPEAQRLSQAGLGGNWGSWHLSAVGVIGYATGHQRFINYALESFKKQIASTLGDDGLWPESVQCYHFYPLDAFLSLAEAAGNCGTDLFHWQARPGKGIEAMFESPLHYMYPTLQLPAINDGWYDAFLPEDQYAVAYSHYHRPEFAWALQRSEQVGRSGVTGDFYDQRYRLFLFGEKLPDLIPAPYLSSTNFPGLGIAILRQGSDVPREREIFLTFHYGAFLGHGHHDKMGITLFANGRPLAPGLGTPGYGSPNMGFFGGVTAHNTIAVDEVNQPRTTDSHLLAFRDEPELKVAAAGTEQIAPGTKWIRAVLLADNYAIVWDHLQSARDHTYDWFFHGIGNQLDLSGVSSDLSTNTEKDRKFPYPFITGVKAQHLNGSNAEASWPLSEEMGLKVWLMGETNDPLFSALCPTTDGKTIPLIALRKSGKDCQFVSILQPWAKQPPEIQIHSESLNPDTLRLTIAQAARMDVILLNPRQIEFDFNAGNGTQEKKLNVPLLPGTAEQ